MNKKPNLIIKIDNKPYSKNDFLNVLANYSAQLYKMKPIEKKRKRITP